MSDTQQAAIRLLASLPLPYLDNLPDAVASAQYDTDLEIAVQSLTQAEARGMERAAKRIDEQFGATDHRIDNVRDFRIDELFKWCNQQAQADSPGEGIHDPTR